MSEHAKLSASGSKKWLNCPLSVTLEDNFQETESDYAKQGTVAHTLAEFKIKLKLGVITRSEYVNLTEDLLKDLCPNEFEELEYYTEGYKDFVFEVFNSYSGFSKEKDLLVEKKLDYSKYVEGGFGTGDIVICDYENIEIIDLKYGKGVKVEAFENSQLMLYGLGALELYSIFDIKNVKLTIYQPRLDNISSYCITTDDLIKWGNEVVRPKAEAALKGTGACVYGSHCDEGFCRARPLCKTYVERHTQVKNYNKKHPSLLTEDELIDVYEIAKSFDKWAGAVKAYILQEMLEGRSFKGLKLVEGKSCRSFIDEKKVIKILEKSGLSKEEFISEKLITVAAAEKLLGKTKFNDILGSFVNKPKGAPTIAPLEDKRAEYNSAELDFIGF